MKSDNGDNESRQSGYLNNLESKESEEGESGFELDVGCLDRVSKLYEKDGQS